ncbi:hypothetical protein F4Z99_05520, partial [Candidatus Poribacteria bacterium]|nr:hypothetical protein [Candidatus Poribacteria bacterium]
MKATCLFLIILFCALYLLLPNVPAQDYIKWSLPDGATMRLGKGSIGNIAFSPNGTRLAVGSAIGIWIYDVRPGKAKELDFIAGHTQSILSIAYSPDASTIAASSSNDGTVNLWNAVTGERQTTLQGHTNAIYSLAYSPDGKTLATGS